MRGLVDPGLLRKAADLAEAGVPVALATVAEAVGSVPGKVGATMLVRDDGSTEGTVGGAGLEERVRRLALDALRAGRGGVHTFDLANWKRDGLDSVCGGTVTVSIHVLGAVPHLLLVGGGHCAHALAQVAHLCGWNVSVVDSRAAFATRERFPHARDVAVATPADFVHARDALDAYSHVYLLGHSHHEDGDVLTQLLLRGFTGVIGVIGSRSKLHAFRERALAAGVPETAFARVRSPIGLDVGAQTPAEIAVAVAAEVVRDLKRGAPEHTPRAADPSSSSTPRAGTPP
jgi:xanthine dehydrogenase accessory factor